MRALTLTFERRLFPEFFAGKAAAVAVSPG